MDPTCQLALLCHRPTDLSGGPVAALRHLHRDLVPDPVHRLDLYVGRPSALIAVAHVALARMSPQVREAVRGVVEPGGFVIADLSHAAPAVQRAFRESRLARCPVRHEPVRDLEAALRDVVRYVGEPAPAAPPARTALAFAQPAAFLHAFESLVASRRVRVPGLSGCPAGAELSVALAVAGEPPIALRAQTVAAAEAGGDAWVRLALGPEEEHALRNLAHRLRQGTPAPRRAARFPVSLAVSFRSGEELTRAYTTDLSHGGVFIATDAPPPVGTRLMVTLELPGAYGSVEAEAEVVRAVTAEEAAGRGGRPGVGVEFVGSGDEVRARVESVTRHLQARAGRRAVVAAADEASLALVRRALEGQGYEVVSASSGDDALRALVDELFSVSVLVVDLALPGTGGASLIRLIREAGGERDLAIVALLPPDGDADAAVRAGADDAVPSGTRPVEILSRIDAAVMRRSAAG